MEARKNAVKNKGKPEGSHGVFWGFHYGVVEDPYGSVWAISASSGEDANDEERESSPKKSKGKAPRTPAKESEKKRGRRSGQRSNK